MLSDVSVAHSKSQPLSDVEGSIVYELQHGTYRRNRWLARRAGYEDGRYPVAPQWGWPTGRRPSRFNREYWKGRRTGRRALRAFARAVPGELESARESLVELGVDAAAWSDEAVFDFIEGGGLRFVSDWRHWLALRSISD